MCPEPAFVHGHDKNITGTYLVYIFHCDASIYCCEWERFDEESKVLDGLAVLFKRKESLWINETGVHEPESAQIDVSRLSSDQYRGRDAPQDRHCSFVSSGQPPPFSPKSLAFDHSYHIEQSDLSRCGKKLS